MSLDDLFGLFPRRKTRLELLQSQIADLEHEIAHLSRSLAGHAGRSASHLGDLAQRYGQDAAHQSALIAGELARQAQRGARAVRQDPVPTLAVLATAALLASFLSRRR